MSEIKQVKDAVQEAKNDLEKEKQEALKKKVKAIIKATLERIEQEEKQVKAHQDNLAILKKDLKDLEAGRLDLIEERQSKDKKAREVSVVTVKKVEKYVGPVKHGTAYQPWYWPFEITPNPVDSGFFTDFSDAISLTCGGTSTELLTLTGNMCSSFAPGTYEMNSGNTIDIRPRFN